MNWTGGCAGKNKGSDEGGGEVVEAEANEDDKYEVIGCIWNSEKSETKNE